MAEERYDEQIQMTPNLGIDQPGATTDSPISTQGYSQSSSEGMKNRLSSYRREAYDRMKKIPDASRSAMSQVDSQVRVRPWAFISGVGIGSLLLGYVLGRSFSSSRAAVIGGMSAEDLEDYS